MSDTLDPPFLSPARHRLPALRGIEPPAAGHGDSIEPAAFRLAMRNLAGAVSIVTAGRPGTRSGLVATSVTGLSAEPATLLVCVNQNASTFPLIRDTGAFAVNVLAADQQAIAERFSGRFGHAGEERYAELGWSSLATGAPVLDAALLALDCEVEDIIPRHSHGIVIGRIREVQAGDQRAGLLYWRTQYRALHEE